MHSETFHPLDRESTPYAWNLWDFSVSKCHEGQNESEVDGILRTNGKKSDLGIIRHHLGAMFSSYEKTLTIHTHKIICTEKVDD